MTNQDYITRKELDKDLDKTFGKSLQKNNAELRMNVSNLVEKMNYYHGTNRNYQTLGNKTNDVLEGGR